MRSGGKWYVGSGTRPTQTNFIDSVVPVSAGQAGGGGGGDKNAPKLASRLKILHAAAAIAGKSRL